MKMAAVPLPTVLLTALVTGCGSSTSETSAPAGPSSPDVAQDRGTIGFSALTLKNPFF